MWVVLFLAVISTTGKAQYDTDWNQQDPFNRNDASTQQPWGRFDDRNSNQQFGYRPESPDYGVNSANNYRPNQDRDQGSGVSYNNNPLTQDSNIGYGGYKGSGLGDVIIKEATYFIVASRMVRPGHLYRVAVSVLQSSLPMVVQASIQRNGVEIAEEHSEVKEGIPETLVLQVPASSVVGNYRLRVAGMFNSLTGGQAFLNETQLVFSQRSMTIFIQTDKPVYMQGQTVHFRTIPINTELKTFNDPVEIHILDPFNRKMRRWLSKQSNLGTVSLTYELSDQPVYGNWTILVIAQSQEERKVFSVEEYYQTRFEVNVTMPAFFFDTDPYVYGIVQANYTSGAPVRGNLTLKASIRHLNKYYTTSTTQYQDVRERYMEFDEYYPSWFKAPREMYDEKGQRVPVLRLFNGTYRFQYPLRELISYGSSTEGMEILITATVGEKFLEEVIVGYSKARIYNSTIKIHFAGDSPQVFKPAMPFSLNLISSFHDGSPLRPSQLWGARLDIRADVEMRSGRRNLESRTLQPTAENNAIWFLKLDLAKELGVNDNPQRALQVLNEVTSMRVFATLIDGEGHSATAELILLAHESPNHKNIKVSTSTQKPKVGEYLVLHVQTNFHIDAFNYIIMSKGIILLSGQDDMQHNIRTFAVPLSPEMAPVATAVVYYVGRYGEVIADSLTFPVNGISRNNFTVLINNRKARTGENVEVAIYGEPGAYVGLSGIDRSFFTMQAGNELTYANVISKMAHFDEESNGTHSHSWLFHDGDPDETVYFPSSSFGIDVNRTFEYQGLVVFTDAIIYRKPEVCNRTLGFGECLNGRCYRLEKKCDGVFDCEDGTDEARCLHTNITDITQFRKYRFNRIQRQYENMWLWKDVNIGPHGRYIFNIDVPRRPVHWMITAFSISPSVGFGMLPRAIDYMGILPFFINVEMPTQIKQGEQIGIRVSVFNYLLNNIEATVGLSGSKDFKFVHVEENGFVKSYNPRTSFGEHQFFVWIKKQDVAIVYLPIVPTRLGDITVHIYANALIGRDSVTRTVHVEADGIPQFRHESVLLDLSNRAYAFQYMHVNITETPIIPYSEERYYVYSSNKARISIVGDVVGPIFPTIPVNATSLLTLPMDCGEQNIFNFAAHLYTTLHMRAVNLRNRTQEKDSFHYMNIMYQKQISFMNPDGSFSLFRSDWNQSSPSVWLTAYTIQVFQEVSSNYEYENYLYIDPDMLAKSVLWLLQHQTEEGSFYEVTWLPDRKMNTTYIDEYGFYRFRNISLTAHVLITLSSVKDLSSGLGTRVALAADNAARWLETKMSYLREFGQPYEIAIVAYALKEKGSSNYDEAFEILNRHSRNEGEYKYWGREAVPQPPTKIENQKPFLLPRLPYKYDSENIETTAYALLLYTAKQQIFFIQPIVRWLNSQRLTDGGWASTRDTAWAMKALMYYTQTQRLREVTQLTVTIEATSLPGVTKTLHVNSKNLATLQSVEIPEAWGTVKVQAQGAGYAILQMTVQYNVDNVRYQTQPPVKAFDLRTRANFHGRNQSHISYISCQRWININESIRSGMAVLDVAVPTGYIIQQQNLDKYVRTGDIRNLQRARFLDQKLLFYFDYLDEEETCVEFTLERWFPVANMSRYLPIRVYDYYAPERFNETMFDSLPTYLLNICEVCGSSQCPYCPIYNIATIITSPSFFTLCSALVVILTRYFRTQEFSVS